MLKFNFKTKFLLAFAVMAVAFIISMPVAAADSDYYVNNYTINAYDVNLNVSENNLVNVTETITTDFSAEKHGIYRDIPIDGTVYWDIDGETVSHTYRMKLKDISVTDKDTGEPIDYEKSSGNGVVDLKIGNEDETFTGEKTYVIAYTIKLGDDGRTEFDELYYNLIGNYWDTYINNMTFTITMPKSFDQTNLSFTSGAYGSTDSSNITYAVTGNTITGKTTNVLAPGEGVTIRLELPDGYFIFEKPGVGYGLIALFVAFLAASLVLFSLFGKDKRVYTTVEVAPPEGINSADAGFIIDGYADANDVVSLIIYWANKGYLAIENDKSDQFTLIKLKDSDDKMKSYEQYMFQKLFEGRDKVTSEDLKYNFNETINMVYADIRSDFNEPGKKLYTKKGNIAQFFSYFMAGLTVGIMFGKGLSDYFWSFLPGLIGGSIAFVLTIVLAALIGYYAEKCRGRAKVGVILTTILYGVFVLLMMVIAAINTQQPIAASVAAIVAILIGIVGAYSKKRTKQGNLWLGQILGLKRFITLAEKNRIETLVEENPSLFYDILPYAYSLGVVNKWADKFKSIALSPPSWYYGSDYTLFNTIVFVSLLNSNLYSFQSDMNAKQPPSSGASGGGFGGGGFSGGGIGGGGGGSW